MGKSTKTVLLAEEPLDEEFVRRALAAVEEAPSEERVRAGLQAMIEVAAIDIVGARSTLAELRADHERLSQLEAWLGGDPARATFALGAAIKVADTELGTGLPDLDSAAAEMLRWLEGDW